MIAIAEGKDIEMLWNKLQEVIERTKRQTKQIQELQKKIKEIQK
jgi:hypothetical protein